MGFYEMGGLYKTASTCFRYRQVAPNGSMLPESQLSVVYSLLLPQTSDLGGTDDVRVWNEQWSLQQKAAQLGLRPEESFL